MHQEVLQAQQRFWAALKNKDPQLFEQVLADEFVSRSPGEPNETRAAFVTTLTTFPASVRAIGADDLEIDIFGKIAVLTCVQVARLRLPNGAEATNRVMLTNVFRQQGHQWRLVLSHNVELPAGP